MELAISLNYELDASRKKNLKVSLIWNNYGMHALHKPEAALEILLLDSKPRLPFRCTPGESLDIVTIKRISLNSIIVLPV